MSLSSAIAEYQNLVSTQPQPNKKQAVQLRKSLMTIKRACDNERLVLLNEPKPEPTTEPPVSPMDPVVEIEKLMPLPLKREVSVDISSTQPVEDIKIEVKADKKKKRKTKKSL